MKKGLILAFVTVGFVVLFGSWTVASADGNRSDFALFDGTQNASPNTGAVCGAGKPGDTKPGKAFTFHGTVTSGVVAGFVRVRYADGDQVDYNIPANGSFNFTGAAGSKGGGAARAIRVCGVGGTILVGQLSAIGEQPFCISCDTPANGGVGNATCRSPQPPSPWRLCPLHVPVA